VTASVLINQSVNQSINQSVEVKLYSTSYKRWMEALGNKTT